MTTEHVNTVVIGAGQSGLSTGYHLKKHGIDFVILEGRGRLGDQWRRHYDSLRLFIPRAHCGLPGMPMPGDKRVFPTGEEFADFIETYAMQHDLPVRTSTPVTLLEQDPSGGFTVHIEGGTIHCDNVVVASGKAAVAKVPAFADQLDASTVQMHSSEYKRPSQLPPGRVVVVGTSHSGLDIAYETSQTHPTTLLGRDLGRVPYGEGLRGRLTFRGIKFVFTYVLSRRTPMGRKAMEEFRGHGGPALRVQRPDLDAREVEWVTQRAAGVRDGKLELADGTTVDAASVIWATGYDHVWDWIKLPILGDDGWPREYRGVVGDVPGLYFCGLVFQSAAISQLIPGTVRDAKYVATQVALRPKATVSAAA